MPANFSIQLTGKHIRKFRQKQKQVRKCLKVERQEGGHPQISRMTRITSRSAGTTKQG
jgi:hypothetical protein